MEKDEINIQGILEKIVFKNPDSGYMVGRIRLEDDELVTIVGKVFELQCGEELEIRVLKSGAGYYIGTLCDEHGPHSRESYNYFGTQEMAQEALDKDLWIRR